MPVVAVVTWLYLCIATVQPNYNCYYYGKRRFNVFFLILRKFIS